MADLNLYYALDQVSKTMCQFKHWGITLNHRVRTRYRFSWYTSCPAGRRLQSDTVPGAEI